MEGCRDRLVAALTRRDHATARRLSSVLDALLHLDGEVRRHAEPRFLVEATLARLAVELGTDAAPLPERTAPPDAQAPTSPHGGGVEGEEAPAPEPVALSAGGVEGGSGGVTGWNEVLQKFNLTGR